MNINIIKSEDRGRTKLDWLDSYHSFSFGRYYNPQRFNFGKLIVFNDDIIEGGSGFGEHPHDNAEVISIAIKGKLKHKDSTGNEQIINEGEIQRMSAGRGIVHSEFNASKSEKAHFLQIWIEPKVEDIRPSYESKNFEKILEKNKFVNVASGNKKDKAIYINQDANIYIADIEKEKNVVYYSDIKKGLYLFVMNGKIKLENNELNYRDSVEITKADKITIEAKENSRILAIEVPL